MRFLRFSADNHRHIFAVEGIGTHREMARHFAELKARRAYGRMGEVGSIIIHFVSGSHCEVAALVGKRLADGSIQGHNVSFAMRCRGVGK